MTRPRLLDLFCCEGGAARGYQAAGFDVTGVDTDKRVGKRYPGTFVHADALEYVKEQGHLFDAVHASPPCQAYSITKHSHSNEHPELVEPTREALQATGLPWIMENVPGAPLVNPVTLCGSSFGLTATDTDGTPLVLKRHRLFESSVWLWPPECLCGEYRDKGYRVAGVYAGGSTDKVHAQQVRQGGYTPGKDVRAALLGVDTDTMTLHGQAQSLPPAYTHYLGAQLMEAL